MSVERQQQLLLWIYLRLTYLLFCNIYLPKILFFTLRWCLNKNKFAAPQYLPLHGPSEGVSKSSERLIIARHRFQIGCPLMHSRKQLKKNKKPLPPVTIQIYLKSVESWFTQRRQDWICVYLAVPNQGVIPTPFSPAISITQSSGPVPELRGGSLLWLVSNCTHLQIIGHPHIRSCRPVTFLIQ